MLAPWKESSEKPRKHSKKSRYITLPAKVPIVKAVVFPVVMYGCKSWSRRLSGKELILSNCGAGEDS